MSDDDDTGGGKKKKLAAIIETGKKEVSVPLWVIGLAALIAFVIGIAV